MIQRRSKQREAILELLTQENYHPTAEEIFHSVRQHIPAISLGTVYRNLDQLCEAGLALKLEDTGSGPAHYEARRQRHLHLCCRKCGQIEDLWPSDDPLRLDVFPSDCHIEDYRLTLIGLCPHCKAAEGTPQLPQPNYN